MESEITKKKNNIREVIQKYNIKTIMRFLVYCIPIIILIVIGISLYINTTKLLGMVIGIVTAYVPFLVEYIKNKDEERIRKENAESSFTIHRDSTNTTDEWKSLLPKVINNALMEIETKSKWIRTDHKLTLTVSKYEEQGVRAVIVERIHEYCVNNPYLNDTLTYPISIKIDLGTYKKLPENMARKLCNVTEDTILSEENKRGGFSSITINDKIFYGSDLLYHKDDGYRDGYKIIKDEDKTKLCFYHDMKIPEKGNVIFKYCAFGVYNLTDKIQWTFSEFCNGLTLRVINKDELKIRYRFNHDKERLLHGMIVRDRENNINTFNIEDSFYPYQGFEIRWESTENRQ